MYRIYGILLDRHDQRTHPGNSPETGHIDYNVEYDDECIEDDNEYVVLEHLPHRIHDRRSKKGLTNRLYIFGDLQAASKRVELFLVFFNSRAVSGR